MSVHTQGPWRVDPDHPCDVQTADGSLEIACVDPLVLVGGNKPANGEEVQANARLIAAAPELLEALEGFVSCWDVCSSPLEFVARARDALAKATGAP